MDAHDNEPSAPKLEGEEAPRRRGRPPGSAKPKPAQEPAAVPEIEIEAGAPPSPKPAGDTMWIKARKPFHISAEDIPGSDWQATSTGLKPGERCEVKNNKRTQGLLTGGFADAV